MATGKLSTTRETPPPENILNRIAFYDIDSRPVQKNLTDREKGLYFREVKRDIAYFSRSFRRAHVSVDITGCSPNEASRKVRDALTPTPLKDQSEASEHGLQRCKRWSSPGRRKHGRRDR